MLGSLKQLVELMGGTVTLDSIAGKGTTMTISLSLEKEPLVLDESGANDAAQPQNGAPGTPRVLSRKSSNEARPRPEDVRILVAEGTYAL